MQNDRVSHMLCLCLLARPPPLGARWYLTSTKWVQRPRRNVPQGGGKEQTKKKNEQKMRCNLPPSAAVCIYLHVARKI